MSGGGGVLTGVTVPPRQLTEYVLAMRLDPLPHLRALDATRVVPLLERRGDA